MSDIIVLCKKVSLKTDGLTRKFHSLIGSKKGSVKQPQFSYCPT